MSEGAAPPGLTIGKPELRQTRYGGVLRLAYAGHYPPGSEGNATADAMIRHTVETLGAHDPAAVGALLFDLTGLAYAWGDAIAGLPLRLRFTSGPQAGAWPSTPRPNVMVAAGQTAAALRSLFGAHRLSGLTGTRVIEDEADAWNDLTARLSLLYGP